MTKRRRDERGAVALIVSLFTVGVLFTICALVVDLGFARDQKQESQNGADGAALAAATVLYQTGGTTGCSVSPCFQQAVQAAETYTKTNFPNITSAMWSACADASKGYVYTGTMSTGVVTNCVSFFDNNNLANSTQPYKVRVVMPEVDNQTFFGGITGVNTIGIQSVARAKLLPGQTRSCGLCLLGSNMNNIGNGSIEVDGAAIHTNGGFSITSINNGLVTTNPTTNSITSVKGCTPSGACVPASTSAPAITDPYATVSSIPPSLTSLTYKGNVSPCGASGGPGIYTFDYTLGNSEICNLPAGLYVVDANWADNNKSLLQGTGVTLYFTCGTKGSGSTPGVIHACNSPSQTGGSLFIKNGNANLSGPTPAQQTATGGISPFVVIYDRNNNADLSLQGNGGKACATCTPNSLYTGTVYAPQSSLQFTGNSAFYVTNGPIIASQVVSNGNKAQMVLQSANGASIPTPPQGATLDQ